MTSEPAQLLPSPQSSVEESQPLIGKGWLQGVALVMIFGFFVMGILAYRTYTASMPMPSKVVTESGRTLFTGAEITRGQEHLPGARPAGIRLGGRSRRLPGTRLHRRLPAHGRPTTSPTNCARRAWTTPTTRWSRSSAPTATTRRPGRWCSPTIRRRRSSASQKHYGEFFGENSTKYGLLPRLITDPGEIHDLTAFFAWTAWAAAADRPGHNYSYTNNWPAESRVDNGPTAQLIVWSALSLIVLLGGTGIMFAVYGRWSQKIGWHSAEAPVLSFRQPGEVALTPAQRATYLVLRHRVGVVLGPGVARRRRAALPGRSVDVLRSGPGLGSCPTTWPGRGTCSWLCSGPPRPSWRVESS